jgi:Rho termination factor, N-terminal domain
MTVAKSNAAETTEGRQLGKEALISCQTGVRQLRRVATQRGVRNAGRMRKPELLAVLELA